MIVGAASCANPVLRPGPRKKKQRIGVIGRRKNEMLMEMENVSAVLEI
jgi:hypothetical protein